MTPNIGFIGGGNMAKALVAGLLAKGIPAAQLCVADPNAACREHMQSLGVRAFEDGTAVMAEATLIVLAVKPQLMSTVMTPLAPALREGQVICSITAGVSIATLRKGLKAADHPIIRAMPNTPALVGEGMTALVSDAVLSESVKQDIETLFNACGRALWVASEEAIDAVTAVSGSGPAYFFLLIEHMIRSATRLGLPRETAETLVIQTARGAARMVEESDVRPDILRARVTSPGGTTEAALRVFSDGALDDLVDRALIAARDRATALSKDT